MPKSKRNTKPNTKSGARDSVDREAAKPRAVRGWLLAGIACLFVAQILLPADGTTAADGAGVPLTMLWLLLVAIWLITTIYRGRSPVRVAMTDWAVLALILLHSISAVWAVGNAPRPAVNMLWEWIALGCCFLLVRQLVTTQRECRVLIVLFVGLATGLSAYCYYQSWIEIPETQRAYETDPERQLKAALGMEPTAMVDPFAKQQFENRLYSQRPTATYLLANSLAAVLTPWLVVCCGIGWSAGIASRRQSIAIGVVVACCLAIGGAMFLTNSRTAWVATLVGLILLLAWRLCCGKRLTKTRVALAVAVSLLAATIFAAVLRVDHPAAAAARLSVQYRVEYWQATAAMIADYPWLGCGPGNFRDCYTAYKLPVALEEVADPHNFLFEVWATAGTPAAVALIVVFVCFFINLRTPRRGGEPSSETYAADEPATDSFLLAGAAAGVLLAVVMSSVYASILAAPLDLIALTIISGTVAAVIAGLWPWVRNGRVTVTLISIAVAAMLVNLSAAGGIGNHGVACSLWVLVALGLNLCGAAQRSWVPSRIQTAVAIITVLIVALVCQRSGYSPVIRSETALLSARLAAVRGDEAAVLDRLREAVAADPFSAGPPRRLTRLLFGHWAQRLADAEPDGETLAMRRRLEQNFREASQAWLDRAPDSAAAHKEVADMYLRAFRAGNDVSLLAAATNAYRLAVERYPNSSILRSHLAWTHALSADKVAAAREAARAIELDDGQPHADLRLDNEFQSIADPEVGKTNTRTLMNGLITGELTGESVDGHSIKGRSIDGPPATTIE